MKTIRLALVSLAASFGSLISFAQQTQADAFVSSVTGSAMVLAPGATEAVPVVIGQKLPEGSTITTAEGANVLIQSHEGIQTGVGAKSSVVVGAHTVSSDGVRTAVIDLKEGTTVSVLDPAKRSVNNYAIRTPKGVAAARGTIYSTTVTLSNNQVAVVKVNTITGAVSFSIADGETISVVAGNTADNNSTAATPVATAYAGATDADKAAILETVKLSATVVAILSKTKDFNGLGDVMSNYASSSFSDPEVRQAFNQGISDGKQAGNDAVVTTNSDGTTTIDATITPDKKAGTPPIDITINEEVQSTSS
jgi:hypothetical protein